MRLQRALLGMDGDANEFCAPAREGLPFPFFAVIDPAQVRTVARILRGRRLLPLCENVPDYWKRVLDV